MTYLISAIAETNRTPFDLPEAESELVGGYHVEFSAMHFGLYFLAEYINMITVSAIATYCFLGGWQPIIPIGGAALGPIWFIIKMAGFIFFYYWLRWTLPRFRYDQLMGLCWKGMLPLVLVNILVVAIMRTLVPADTPPAVPRHRWSRPGPGWPSSRSQLVFAGAVIWAVSRGCGRHVVRQVREAGTGVRRRRTGGAGAALTIRGGRAASSCARASRR